MSWMEWYQQLAKPGWTPSPTTISIIWQVLYLIIAVTFGFVAVQWLRGKLSWRVLAPFGLNLAANLIFTPILFGLRNLSLATVDILIVLGTIIWLCIAIWPHYRWVALAQLPYLVWVCTATVLQLSITAMNWHRI